MKTYDFRGPGGGFVSDSNAFTLQDNEWSDMNNVRIHNRAISKIAGHRRLYSSALGTSPRHSQFLRGAGTGQFYYYVDSLGDTYRINAAGSAARVTKGLSNSNRLTVSGNMQLSPISGGTALLVNDGARTPAYITSVGTGTHTTQLVDIPGWNYNSAVTNLRCGTIRPFKYVMVAGNLTYTNSSSQVINNAGTIRVSNQAAPGALPTWDPSAAGSDTADEFELASDGHIVDMVSIGDTLAIFTEDSIFGLRLTGSTTQPVQVSKQLQGRGMLASNCGVEFFGKLFVVGNEDIYLFQGGAATQTVADGRVRDYFFDNLNGAASDNTFVVHNERHDEMWVCYPKGNSTACNEALIWNYVHNNWTRRALPDVYTGGLGPNITSDAFVYSDYQIQLPATSGGNRIQTMDTGTTFDGTAFTAYVERKGMDLAPANPGLSKWNDSIYFLLTGAGSVNVKARPTDTPGRPVDFNSTNDRFLKERTFNIDGDMSDLKIDPRVNGKFFNIRIEGQDEWSLHSYTVNFEEAGERSE